MIITEKENNLNLLDGYQEITVDVNDDVILHINAEKNSNVFLKFKNAKNVTINYIGRKDSNVTLLLWNEAVGDMSFVERYNILENAGLKLAYGDLSFVNFKRDCEVYLMEKGANALVKSAALVKNSKDYKINVISASPYTEGDIENYSVVLENGNYKMDATGSIKKGAYQSSSHQTSRAICLSDKQKTFIQPNLLIDDNDVEASHATSVGRLDESQMVYMQSRGLKVNDILALISFGYLLPIADMIENEDMKNQLREAIESQVSKECLM